jgi:hypothetical protein
MTRLMIASVLISMLLVALIVPGCSSPRKPGVSAAAAPANGSPSRSIPITITSGFPPVTGDVYVKYQSPTGASAQIQGQISDTASGEVARLYAQQFPYSAAPVPTESLTLTLAAGTAKYAFRVTPTLATRYQVKLFRSSTATIPLASSVTSTIYVAVTKEIHNYPSCSRPVCHETITLTTFVPPAALKTEMSKPWYTYFGLDLSKFGKPAPPKWAQLGAGDPSVTKPQRISADEFDMTISFTFQIGNAGYEQHWRTCSKDTEGEDGMGLPGSHGCGGERVLASASYIG